MEKRMLARGTRSAHAAAGIGMLAAAVTVVTACSGGGANPSPGALGSPGRLARVVSAPRGLLAAAQPQPNGMLWALAGDGASKGLFELSLTTGHVAGSISVSNAARSVTESLSGVVGLALATPSTGALELVNGSTGTPIRTIQLGAPARDVVVGNDGTTFYVLNGTPQSASVTVVNSRDGSVQGMVPVPLDTVSVAPDTNGSELYALQPSGRVSEIAVAGGKILSAFPVGGTARSLAMSPDGATLYVLKDTGDDANVAEVNLATDGVQRVVPAAAHSVQLLVSADGEQLYQLVGTPWYGNIQVSAA
jgi:DNA-binding beta-propeller fold protein YncE